MDNVTVVGYICMEWSKASMEHGNYYEAGRRKRLENRTKKKKHQGQDSSIAVLTMRRGYRIKLI